MPLGGPKQRAVLAVLVARVGQRVSTEYIVDALYGGLPTDGARRSVQIHVSNLRREFSDVIRPKPDGYVLDVSRRAVDATSFEDCWKTRSTRLAAEISRLIDRRLVAVEARIEQRSGRTRFRASPRGPRGTRTHNQRIKSPHRPTSLTWRNVQKPPLSRLFMFHWLSSLCSVLRYLTDRRRTGIAQRHPSHCVRRNTRQRSGARGDVGDFSGEPGDERAASQKRHRRPLSEPCARPGCRLAAR